MKTKFCRWLTALTILTTPNPQLSAAPFGTAFTYQGRLNDNGTPANGSYDLRFTVCDALTNGNLVAGPLTNSAAGITDGLFTATLDFGGVFNGSNYWLEIGARTNGGGAFTTLSPRQLIVPTPYTIYSANAGNAATAISAVTAGTAGSANSVSATNIVGAVPRAATATNAPNGTPLNNLANAVTNLPVITCYPDGSYFYNGTTYRPTNSLTCGLQEAMDTLPIAANASSPGGGTLFLAPGIFQTYTTIMVHTHTNPFTLTLIGSGLNACGITYMGSAPQDVMTVGYPQTPSQTIFKMENMWMASALNACTNILEIRGYSAGSGEGGVAKCEIDFCWFGYWQSMTTASPFGFSPSTFGDSAPHNLIPINVNCNYNEGMLIQNCQFTYVNGVSWSTDHGQILNNIFEFVGNGGCGAPNNQWPKNSVYSIGASVYCVEPTGGTFNGNKGWLIQGNNFVACGSAYYAPPFWNNQSYLSYDDTFEPCGGALVATAGSHWTLVNPYGPWQGLNSYVVTNTLDYSTWNNMSAASWGTNLVTIVDARTATNSASYTFGGNLTVFGTLFANGAGLTNLPANAISGGITTNILIGGHTFYITNGVIMNVQ